MFNTAHFFDCSGRGRPRGYFTGELPPPHILTNLSLTSAQIPKSPCVGVQLNVSGHFSAIDEKKRLTVFSDIKNTIEQKSKSDRHHLKQREFKDVDNDGPATEFSSKDQNVHTKLFHNCQDLLSPAPPITSASGQDNAIEVNSEWTEKQGKNCQFKQYLLNINQQNEKRHKKQDQSYRHDKILTNLPIVSESIQLPLDMDSERPPILFIPCAQFPDTYLSSTTMPVEFWRKYHTKRVSFVQKEIGYFSTANRANRHRCREDYRYLKRLLAPLEAKKVGYDLNIGAEYLEAKEPPASLESLMWWIVNHKSEVFVNGKFTFQFLSWRGTLRKIMQSLFDHTVDWRIGVIRWKGCHFITVFHTETELNIENSQSAVEKRMCYWGHKFEDYVSKKKPDIVPSPKKIFSSINQATLGTYTLVYGSEIDACTVDSQLDSCNNKQVNYVEIKVVFARNILDLHTESSRKYAKWWQQCFLAGIEHMLLGFRNESGIVEALQPVSLKDIEKRAKTWSASSFISFLNEFCAFVHKTVTADYSDYDKNVYLFYYSPKGKLIKWLKSDEKQYQFLPEWFTSHFTT